MSNDTKQTWRPPTRRRFVAMIAAAAAAVVVREPPPVRDPRLPRWIGHA